LHDKHFFKKRKQQMVVVLKETYLATLHRLDDQHATANRRNAQMTACPAALPGIFASIGLTLRRDGQATSPSYTAMDQIPVISVTETTECPPVSRHDHPCIACLRGHAPAAQNACTSRHKRQQRRPTNQSQLATLSLAILASSFFLVSSALDPSVIGLNQTVLGSTASAPQNVYAQFMDNRVGQAGHLVYRLHVANDSNIEIVVSTCEHTAFETYMAIFNGTDLRRETQVAESGGDPSCKLAAKRAGLTFTATAGEYAILITGHDAQEGSFTLTISSRIPRMAPLPWGLDRIDQRYLPLDTRYTVSDDILSSDLRVYVLDSGIRSSHVELQGRILRGFDATNSSSQETEDCTGSGTSAASIIAGKNIGVAKSVRLVPVRVLDCDNKGTISAAILAIEWVLISFLSQPTGRTPGIIYLRFRTKNSDALNKAVGSAHSFGFPVVIPAGDEGSETDCQSMSPASSGYSIVVGSSTVTDFRSASSNFGDCVNLYAPGSDIPSATQVSDSAYDNVSGTAQAAAHVAGVAAILMNLNPGITAIQVKNILVTLATKVVKDSTDVVAAQGGGSLVYVRSVPPIAKVRPPPGSILIYFILSFKEFNMSQTSCLAEIVKPRMVNVLNMDAQTLSTACYTQAQLLKPSTSVVFRLLESESRSLSLFRRIQQALVTDKARTAQLLGSNFDILESSWFVDSSGITFWGEPQVARSNLSKYTPGVVAGIVIGVLLLLIILLSMACVIYRLYAKKDEVQSMQGSGDMETSPPQFDDFAKSSSRANGPAHPTRSYRNVFEGLGRSMSARRFSAQNTYGESSRDNNASRRESFADVRGGKQNGGLENIRMHSYGGEAFVGIGRMSRSQSQFSEKSPRQTSGLNLGGGENRVASFRGKGNITSLNRKSTYGEGSPSSESLSDLRLHSVGGEAFSVIGVNNVVRNHNLPTNLAVDTSAKENTGQIRATGTAVSPEALARVSGDVDERESSFFRD
jgi:Subtilase family